MYVNTIFIKLKQSYIVLLITKSVRVWKLSRTRQIRLD